MKLVIDIPEEVYKCVMDGTWCGSLYEEMKNGVPVEPDKCGDYISRQAVINRLNKLIEVEKKQGTDDWGYGRERVNAYEAMLHFVKSEYLYPSVEPEKCEDCISRQAVLEKAINVPIARVVTEDKVICRKIVFAEDIEDLPPVTPQPKIGHWILKHRTHNSVKHYTGQDEMGETHTISVLERYEVNEPYCSECGKLAGDTSQDYCCACGAKMEVLE